VQTLSLPCGARPMVGLPLTMIKDALNSFLVNHVRNPHGIGISLRSRLLR
jgi:hypothetical protein